MLSQIPDQYSQVRNIGKTLTRRHKSNLEERNRQVEGHQGFTQTIDTKLVDEWELMCQKWENDCVPKTAKNPYHVEGLSESFGLPVLLPSAAINGHTT